MTERVTDGVRAYVAGRVDPREPMPYEAPTVAPDAAGVVRAWEEQVTIPTYRVGRPDRNPMFLETRVYQGSSGVVYPHPVIDRVFDEREDRAYTALFLENRYLKVMILPELGGRVQMALDKTNGYHFVYHNRVVKPALVGLAGPWISGGIEFNWPQHHRPSTFDPVEYAVEERAGGGRTVWCAEVERMFRTRSAVGFTLHPDRAVLELDVRLSNRTAEPQTFLWWANPAVHVNDSYQSVFPADVHAVMDHGKRDVSTFPIARGTYYKVNYAPGTDISRYKNIPVPTSYMAYHSDFDFLGCYDHGVGAGMMHVADHHVVPGKKQWTWGHGDFGRAWDRQLTDADGPYVELMCGAYTDNQPDFSWLMPGEEKRFTQAFLPYKAVGAATNASAEAVLRLAVRGEGVDRAAELGVYVTRPRRVRVLLRRGGEPLYEREVELSPACALADAVALGAGVAGPALTLEVWDAEAPAARPLLAYTPPPDATPGIPAPAAPAPAPEAIASNEELYLNGLHLEQYRHATYAPEPYYEEALRRDPGDSRCNVAMGRLCYRRGQFAAAEAYARRAVERVTLRNPNPYDGEPHYLLGLALRMRGRYAEATDAFAKAAWNEAWQAAAWFELARLACRRGDADAALDYAERALGKNAAHHQARHLAAAVCRRAGRAAEARAWCAEALARDPLVHGALYERELLDGGEDSARAFAHAMRGAAHNYVELALDYAHAGLADEALAVLAEAPAGAPMVHYFAGWIEHARGRLDAARAHWAAGEAAPREYCFPNQLECVPAFGAAIATRPDDARAPYYLGLLLYARRRHDDAVALWERARALDPAFPTVHRNLGLAYVNVRGDVDAGLAAYERAFALDPSDARVLFELDQLRKKRGEPPASRRARLEAHPGLVAQRDDLAVEYVTLLSLAGAHAAALAGLTARTFHPWEGGEGKVTGQYVTNLVELAKQAIAAGDARAAVELLARARTYPDTLGEGKLAGAQENHIFYHLGRAHARLGEADAARACYERAASGLAEPTSAVYYNDQPPDTLYYQGLAHRALGRAAEAEVVFRRLAAYGAAHLDDEVRPDYFAVSLPDFAVFDDDPSRRNRVHCLYMLALGHLGLGEHAAAERHFREVLALEPAHLGATLHRAAAVETA